MLELLYGRTARGAGDWGVREVAHAAGLDRARGGAVEHDVAVIPAAADHLRRSGVERTMVGGHGETPLKDTQLCPFDCQPELDLQLRWIFDRCS